MKYWKEKGSTPTDEMKFWTGNHITKLEENEIFVMGTNPGGIHGAGAAKAGMKFGAKIGFPRGKIGSTWGLITKNLEGKEGFVEKETGLVYEKSGFRSVSEERIRENILELYTYAKNHPHEKYLITYQYEAWPNGTPKKSLNGYTSQEMLEMFAKNKEIPLNIIFHDSYKPHLEKLFKKENKLDEISKIDLTSPISNLYPSKFKYKDLTFICNSQFIVYSKAKTFKDEVTAKKIIDINNDQLIKDFINGSLSINDIIKDKDLLEKWKLIMIKFNNLGKDVKYYNAEVWNQKESKVDFFGAKLKYVQNVDLKQILLDSELSTNQKSKYINIDILKKIKNEIEVISKINIKTKP